jgi:hypothetical protein
MDHYTSERLLLGAHRTMIRTAEERARMVPETGGSPLRWWVAGRLRGLADRLDGRPASSHLRLVR